MAEHLKKIGITCVEQLKGADPEQLYLQDCVRQGQALDRCVSMYTAARSIMLAMKDTNQKN